MYKMLVTLENGSASVASTADDDKVVVVVCETTETIGRAAPEGRIGKCIGVLAWRHEDNFECFVSNQHTKMQ